MNANPALWFAHEIATRAHVSTALVRIGAELHADTHDGVWAYVSNPSDPSDTGASLCIGRHEWWGRASREDLGCIVGKWIDNDVVTRGPRVEKPK